MLSKIFGAIEKLATRGQLQENWSTLNINIDFYEGVKNDLEILSSYLKDFNDILRLQLIVDTDHIVIDEVEDYIGSPINIIINKLNLTYIEDFAVQFFYSYTEFESWFSNISIFKSPEINSKLKIVINDLKTICGGPNIIFTNDIATPFDSMECILPSEQIISEYVYIPKNTNLHIDLCGTLITFVNKVGKKKETNQYYKLCIRNCAVALCSAVVDELDTDLITVINGIKRIRVPLYNTDTPELDLETVLLLKEIVEWIYNENDSSKIKTKRKLFVDRITLDIDYEEPLLNELPLVLKNAFDQAKERYSYVILERRDKYAKELGTFLKDLKNQCDLYSQKIRTLLSNIMRDVLAGLLLIGFTLFTKFTELEQLNNYDNLIKVIFRGLSLYFIISASMQVITDISDVILSRREFKYWSKCISEIIPQKELETHIKKSLNIRTGVSVVIYCLLICLYFVVILLTWNFPQIWNNIFAT